MTFLKIIFFLIVFFYVMKLIFKYIIPKAVFHFLNRQQHPNGTKHTRRSRKEGEINIKMDKQPKTQKNDIDFGEYVDFEEVKPEQKSEDEQKSKPGQKPEKEE